MQVTTARQGESSRNDRSLSSASAMNVAPLPSAAPSPVSARMPPMTYDGSAPALRRMVVSIDVVVVLPDGGRHDHCVGIGEVSRRMAHADIGAEGGKLGEQLRRCRVAAGYRDAPGQQDAGDPGHACPADAGEMHPA